MYKLFFKKVNTCIYGDSSRNHTSKQVEEINLLYITEIDEVIQASYILVGLGFTLTGVSSFFKKLSS